MQAVVRWSLKNRSVVFLATLILIAGGAYATTRLNQELVPQIEFPVVTVATPVPGSGPDLIDGQVTQEIEGAVEGVEGIENVRSTSSPGFSLVVVEFALDTDIAEAEAEVNSVLEGVELPQQALDPEVSRQSFSRFPIQNISLSAGDGDLARLTDYAENEAVPLIEEVEGVASADLVGGAERRIFVELDPEALERENLSADAAVGAISGASVNAPAGAVRVEGLSTPVRATNGPANVEALEELPVGASGGAPSGAPSGGASAPPAVAPTAEAPEPVLLGDVAEVREVEADLSGISRTNGEPSLGINVVKETDANTVEVARGVEGALDRVREDLGEDGVVVVSDTSEAVEESVNGLVEKALIGGVLAVVIIFVFLRSFRATLVTAVSLPTSILAALLFSWGYDLTLNIVTLAGLTIAVGRVVDDAIVVLENAYRYVQQGYGPEEAALRGSTEVASAITSSTLTTTAVFLPLGLVGGIVSEFFLPLSLTVTFALLASLLVAVTIIPVLTSVFIRRRGAGNDGAAREPASRREGGDGWLARGYVSALRWSLRHRLVVVLFAVAVFAGGLAVVPFLGASFFPPSEERLVQADIELPAGTALGKTSDELRPFEDSLLDDPGVEDYQISAGGEDSTGAGESPQRADNQAQAFITVRENADPGDTLDRLSDRGNRLYGQDFRAEIVQNGPPTGGLEITLTGGTEDDLARASGLIVQELQDNDDLANVESDLSETSPEIVARLDDQRAAEAGLSPSQVPTTLGALLGGSGGQGTSIEVGEEVVSVGVPEESADSLEEVRALPLGPETSVGDVAEVEPVAAPAEVPRVGGERAVTITGNITSEDTSAVNTEVQNAIDGLDLPGGVSASLGGESEDIAESFRNIIISIAVAVALVYLVLVVFFGSLTVPLVILLSVPLMTSGSFGALLVTGTPVSLPALLGVLLLIGIVVSNAILLVDFAQNLRSSHGSVNEALVEAGRERLRPILMTALATVFALVPLALGISFTGSGGGGLISSSLAIPVVGGLVTSTLLTLFVVPVGYSLLKRGNRKDRDGEPRPGRAPEPARTDPPSRTGDGPVEAPIGVPVGAAAKAAGDPADRNGRGGDPAAGPADASVDREPQPERRDDLLFELGRARGRTEVLEGELRRLDCGTGRVR